MSTPLWIACGKLAFPVNENELANNKRESGGMLPHALWLGLSEEEHEMIQRLKTPFTDSSASCSVDSDGLETLFTQ